MYYFGIGVTQDYTQSRILFTQSAEQGNAIAQYRLGYILEEGLAGAKEPLKALEWYRKSAEQGNAIGQYYLAEIYIRRAEGIPYNREQAIYWYTKSAEQGDTDAQVNLGALLYRHGSEEEQRRAVDWYRKAAEEGVAMAQFNLGNALLGEKVLKR